jgi:hypothetical protein
VTDRREGRQGRILLLPPQQQTLLGEHSTVAMGPEGEVRRSTLFEKASSSRHGTLPFRHHGAHPLGFKRIFSPGPMGLRDQLLRMPIEQRLPCQPNENLFL